MLQEENPQAMRDLHGIGKLERELSNEAGDALLVVLDPREHRHVGVVGHPLDVILCLVVAADIGELPQSQGRNCGG